MATTAFALAGLGGFNAHGAGFLTAASECGVAPDLVTATSGQIVVLADWLLGKDLEKALVVPELEHNLAAQIAIAFSGDPGVFRPAYADAIRRWLKPPSPWDRPLEFALNRLAPAQLYVPTRKHEDFETIAQAFNSRAKVGEKDIGIIFNAYDFATGEAVLFGNDTARKNKKLWPPSKKIPQKPLSAGARRRRTATNTGSKEPELELRQITAEAVESALWLSLYGFEGLPQPHLIDGAYTRSCIVSELHQFDRIFVARPLARGWPGKPPRNWFEVQDWQTEMWFSAGYKAEVDTLTQINRLVDNGTLGRPFKHVDLIEIAPERPAGFFNYFIERKKVFKRAYSEAIKAFSAIGTTSRAGGER